jgi:hypothetical protein
MSLRNFTDSQGTAWRVWNVIPQYAAVRDEDVMTPGLQGGWLCFDSGNEKRRLSPIPEDWESAGRDALEAYCRRAAAVQQRATAGGTASV